MEDYVTELNALKEQYEVNKDKEAYLNGLSGAADSYLNTTLVAGIANWPC